MDYIRLSLGLATGHVTDSGIHSLFLAILIDHKILQKRSFVFYGHLGVSKNVEHGQAFSRVNGKDRFPNLIMLIPRINGWSRQGRSLLYFVIL